MSMLVKFEIYPDGRFWCGRGIGRDIFTQGRTLDELMAHIREAARTSLKRRAEPGRVNPDPHNPGMRGRSSCPGYQL